MTRRAPAEGGGKQPPRSASFVLRLSRSAAPQQFSLVRDAHPAEGGNKVAAA
ncbi:hypothetical protein OHB24_21990 [Kribbella sp. NBC_00482]|uniref:hypothetical protein n=1 Tax=Kribbella sp. NBC_00482 TaxID=2975968 RepID=UPI002E188B23